MNSTTRDKALTTINVVIWVFLIAAAAISFSHIVESGYHLGLAKESWTAPMFIDGIAVVGKVSMLPRFSQAFRRSGFRLLMLGGSLSLAANVYAGHNLGQRMFGVLVVAGFMALESHATKASRAVAIAARVGRPWSDERRAAHAARKATPVVETPAPPVQAPVVAPAPVRHAVRTTSRRQPISPLTGRPLLQNAA